MSTSVDGIIILTAQNEKAKKWMGEAQSKLPVTLAMDYEVAAVAAGLTVESSWGT